MSPQIWGDISAAARADAIAGALKHFGAASH